MLNVKKTLTKILDALKVDYIVERGTSGKVAGQNVGVKPKQRLLP